ncbi:MAG: hypothetical protein AMXMBFR7_51990 [Planctomycetota bacterium]
MQWPRDYLIAMGFTIFFGLLIFGMVWCIRELIHVLTNPDNEPNWIDFFLERHAPRWLLRAKIYPDEFAIILVLFAASVFGALVWLDSLLTQ